MLTLPMTINIVITLRGKKRFICSSECSTHHTQEDVMFSTCSRFGVFCDVYSRLNLHSGVLLYIEQRYAF